MGIISINLDKETLEKFDREISNVINKDNRTITRSKAINTMLGHMLLSPTYIQEILESYGYILIPKETTHEAQT